MTHKLVGFDRKIHLSWLDATADWASQRLPAADIRKQLDRLLDGQVAGIGSHSARGKTMTVLMHVWVLVPDPLVLLRDDGLLLLRDRGEDSRLPLHWGMCLAGYPFFRDVASTTGRLLSLQGSAALSQIVRRMTESWGTRSTVTRAVQRIVRSFVAWGVVVETEERGIIAPAPKIAVHDPAVGAWLLEAGIADGVRRAYRSTGLRAHPRSIRLTCDSRHATSFAGRGWKSTTKRLTKRSSPGDRQADCPVRTEAPNTTHRTLLDGRVHGHTLSHNDSRDDSSEEGQAVHQLTVRGFDAELADSIRRLARQERISLNQAVLRLLRRGAGLADDQASVDPSAPRWMASSVAGRASRRMRWIALCRTWPLWSTSDGRSIDNPDPHPYRAILIEAAVHFGLELCDVLLDTIQRAGTPRNSLVWGARSSNR